MTDKKTFILVHAEARRRAVEFVAGAPDGWVVTIEPPRRGSEINAALHAKLGEIAASREWDGRRWDIDGWKRMLSAAWGRATGNGVLMVRALDGAGVDVIYRHTSKMTQREVSDLLAYIEAWAAETEIGA